MSRKTRQFWRAVKASVIRRYEACFPEPAEVRLLEICGGTTLTIGRIKRQGRPFTLLLSHGHLLASEHFKRVAIDNRTILFMNDIDQAIVVRGNDYQHDVVRYQELEDQLLGRGLRVQFIPQSWLEHNPAKALSSIRYFLYS